MQNITLSIIPSRATLQSHDSLINCPWLIEEHYPEALLGTDALKSAIKIKYKYVHSILIYKYDKAISISKFK